MTTPTDPAAAPPAAPVPAAPAAALAPPGQPATAPTINVKERNIGQMIALRNVALFFHRMVKESFDVPTMLAEFQRAHEAAVAAGATTERWDAAAARAQMEERSAVFQAFLSGTIDAVVKGGYLDEADRLVVKDRQGQSWTIQKLSAAPK